MRDAVRAPLLAAVLALLLAAAAPAVARTPVELGAAISNDGFQGADARYRDTLAQYDAVVAENAFKIAELQPQQGVFAFGIPDEMVAWASAHGQQVHGHTLVWCDDQWLPSWLTGRAWTADELRAVMTGHITTVMQHFGAAVSSWDVVNEAFNADGTLRDCLWSRVLGPGYIEDAFRAAHTAVPAAKLFYNEYKADWVNSKFTAMEDLARDFRARSVPLDGIGLQQHLFGRAPPQYRLQEAIRRLGALGLTVQVSELDDVTSSFTGTTAEKLDQEAQAYQTVAAACQGEPACTRLTTWGFTDAYSWRGPAELALPFDTEYRPKPAWDALQRVLRTPAPAPGNHVPGAPGPPLASATVNRGQFTITWAPAADADGEPVTYALQHRDADDPDWTTIASGMRTTSYAFSATWPEPQGTWTYRLIASDAATDGAPSVTSAAVVVDRAAPRAPAVAADRAPEAADGGWFADQVTLGFASAGDPPLPDGSPGSGVDPASLPAPQAFTATGAHTASGTVTDLAGNVSAEGSGSAQVDATPPLASSGAVTGDAPYLAGTWTNQPVTVRLSCTDEGSGVATADPDAVVQAEGAGQQVTQTCSDRVGHAAAAAFGPIAIDRTPPSAPDRTAWTIAGTPLTLRAGVTDPAGGSGVDAARTAWTAPGSPPRIGDEVRYTFPAAGTRAVKLAFRDGAGNPGAAVATVNVLPGPRSAAAGDVLARIPRALVPPTGGARVLRLQLRSSSRRTVRAAVARGRRVVVVRRVALAPRATRTLGLALPASDPPGTYVVRLTVFHGARRVGREIRVTVAAA